MFASHREDVSIYPGTYGKHLLTDRGVVGYHGIKAEPLGAALQGWGWRQMRAVLA